MSPFSLMCVPRPGRAGRRIASRPGATEVARGSGVRHLRWLAWGSLIWGSGALVACATPAADSAGEAPSASTTGTDSEGDTASTTDEADLPIYSSGSLGDGDGLGGATSGVTDACLRVLSLGAPAASGVVPGGGGMDALVDWFNRATNAQATHIPDPTPFTSEMLAQYDVVLLQDLALFNITQEDVDAVAEWVKGGGALLALSGYDGDGAEVPMSNRLLSFSGLGFSVTAQDTALSLGDCGYCLGTSRKMAGFNPAHPISKDVAAVGSFLGRSIVGQGQVVLADEGQQLAVAKEIEQGRVFLFHDDWVSYVPQWTGQVDVACTSNVTCAQETPEQSYQVAQFWYNVLRWSAPEQTCFTSDAPEIMK